MERWKILAGLVSFTFFMKKHPAVTTAIAFQFATFTSLAHKSGASPYTMRIRMSTNNSKKY
ncbi:hypothetical protein [Pseudomonas sp. PS02302]|uniref:hypothetical protein n=1 Tax=Pseudomonas sp. PS02302 TaxID=2991428 RepID=UPI00249C7A6A|nr:hypothetical protein [Pseudomonas sp. PS02302]